MVLDEIQSKIYCIIAACCIGVSHHFPQYDTDIRICSQSILYAAFYGMLNLITFLVYVEPSFPYGVFFLHIQSKRFYDL